MRLAIADPPYLGTAELWYGSQSFPGKMQRFTGGVALKADEHPDAAIWDDPETHRALVERLVADYDGWVIALRPQELRYYLQWVPTDARVAVWHKTQSMPNGSHPRQRWEAVIVGRPVGRRTVAAVPLPVADVLTCPPVRPSSGQRGFAGRKPLAWTEWVLSMLGYCPTHDTVNDLFHGSGAVNGALAQGRMIDCKCYPSVTGAP